MSETNENPEVPAPDFGALLDARDATLVTLVAGTMQLAVHKSVLVTKSPVFAAMLGHDMVEGSSGRIVIADVEPEVVRQLVLFMYTDSAPQLRSMAPQLLVAADKYCASDLKAQCETQMIRDVSVENVVTSAFIALRHSCPRLKELCGLFVQGNFVNVMGTEGWAEAVSKHPEEFMELSQLIAAKLAKMRSGSQENMDQKLLTAAENCRFEEVDKLLDAGANVGAQDTWKRTALHYAVVSGNGSDKTTKTANCLLEAGAHVNARDRWLQTPLHAAVQTGHRKVIEALLAASSDVNAADVHGDTPLHLAAEAGDGGVVQALLSKGADKGAKNDRDETPLLVAECCENFHLLHYLSVSDKADVSETETLPSDLATLMEGSDAALVTLVLGGMQLAVHRSVLMAKSSVFAKMLADDATEGSGSRIVVTGLERKVMHQLVVFMYTDSAPQVCSMAPQLLVAADKYCVPALKSECERQLVRDLSVENVVASALLSLRHDCPLLKEKAGSFLMANFTRVVGTEGWADAVRNSPGEFLEFCCLLPKIRCVLKEKGDQELLDAARCENSTKCRRLLATGADVAARDESGKTALHIAAGRSNNAIILNILLQAGADVESRDASGKTALHYAAFKGCNRNTNVLLEAGALVDARNRWLQTPLHTAVRAKSRTVIELFLAASSDVNAADVHGDTPLHLAAQWGDSNVVQALLKRGADKVAKNDRNETPLHVAERFKRNHLLAVLKCTSPICL